MSDVIFDPRVQTFCVSPSFQCPYFDHSWSCPPVAPYLEEEISKYKRFFLIYTIFDLKKYITEEKVKHPKRNVSFIRNKFYMKNLLRDDLEKEVFNFLEEYDNPKDEKLILWDGTCRICHNEEDLKCTYDSGNPCRYPNIRRYSMEAVGIDVTRTVKNLSLDVEWPPINYAYRFGLVCLR